MVFQEVKNLHLFFKTGHTKDILFRHHQLAALKQAIINEEKILLSALEQDLGKPPFESYISELYIILQELNYALSELHSWSRPIKVPTPFIHFPIRSMLHPEPRGVVLIIGAWNYPLQLMLVPLIGAIAAGNCALLKPSEHAPHSSAALAKLIAKTFDNNYITVIEGDSQQAHTLLQEKFDYIFFTGSSHVGSIVMQEAAKQLTPITLELGGKNPSIVTPTASLDCAAKRIVWGKFYNAGQNCISPDYLLVHSSIKDTLIEKLIVWIKKFYGEQPMESPNYARIINHKNLNRLQQLLSGGSIIFGGTIDIHNRYMAPTLLDNVDLHAPLMHEEIFGPLLPIIPYTTLDEAIAFITQRPHPLALYLFSSSKQEQNIVLNQTQSGGVCINDTLMHAASPYLPFGGIGASGFGAYHGKKTFDVFTHYKPVVSNSCRFDHNLRYPPYEKKQNWLQKFLTKFNW